MTRKSIQAKALRNTIIKVATCGGSNSGAYARYREALMSGCELYKNNIPDFVYLLNPQVVSGSEIWDLLRG